MAAWEAPGFVAVVIGSDGKPVREFNEGGKRTARVPFGTEYKLRLKNTTNARAYVRVEIDGMDVLSGSKLILRAKSSMDLERFLEHNNYSGRKFQFVTANHPGVSDPSSGENGLVRVIFEPEYVCLSGSITFTSGHGTLTGPYIPNVGMGVQPGIINTCYMNNSGAQGGGGAGGTAQGGAGATVGSSSTLNVQACANSANTVLTSNGAGNLSWNASCSTNSLPKDLGATAAGGHSNQGFVDTNEWFSTLSPVFVDIWMKGPKAEVPKVFSARTYAGAGQPTMVWYQNQVIQGVKTWNYGPDGLHIVIDPAYVDFR